MLSLLSRHRRATPLVWQDRHNDYEYQAALPSKAASACAKSPIETP
jgi:hypothetical protein